MSDAGIRDEIKKEFDPQLCGAIRELWKAHSIAEDARDIPGLLSTLTADCVYDIVGTAHRWEGHEGAAQFYSTLIGAVPNIRFHLTQIVIGPQGVFEEANVTGAFVSKILQYEPTGRAIQFSLGILFPWDSQAKKFSGERIYINLDQAFGS